MWFWIGGKFIRGSGQLCLRLQFCEVIINSHKHPTLKSYICSWPRKLNQNVVRQMYRCNEGNGSLENARAGVSKASTSMQLPGIWVWSGFPDMKSCGRVHAIRCTITLVLGQFTSHRRDRASVGIALNSGHKALQIVSEDSRQRACGGQQCCSLDVRCLLSRRRLKDLLMSRSKYRMSRDALPSPDQQILSSHPGENNNRAEGKALTSKDRKLTTTRY
jgi:hypothetical protein